MHGYVYMCVCIYISMYVETIVYMYCTITEFCYHNGIQLFMEFHITGFQNYGIFRSPEFLEFCYFCYGTTLLYWNPVISIMEYHFQLW